MPTQLSPDERRLRSSLAAHAMHAQHDARAHGRRAQEAILAKLEHEVDPDSTLPPEERQRRARHLRKSRLVRLAFEREKRRREERARKDAQEALADATLLAESERDVAEGGV